MKEFTTTITEDGIKNGLHDAMISWECDHNVFKTLPDGTEFCALDGITEDEIIEDAFQTIVDFYDMFGGIRTDYYSIIDDIASIYLEEQNN